MWSKLRSWSSALRTSPVSVFWKDSKSRRVPRMCEMCMVGQYFLICCMQEHLMMVDSVLKELGRAEAGLASRNRSVNKIQYLLFLLFDSLCTQSISKSGNQLWRLHISSSSTSLHSVRTLSWSHWKRLEFLNCWGSLNGVKISTSY